MKRTLRGSASLLLVVMMSLLACSKVTQASFNRIKSNMTYDQVVEILGEPTDSKSLGVGPLSGTSARWEGDDAVITVTFLNGKVKTKKLKPISQE